MNVMMVIVTMVVTMVVVMMMANNFRYNIRYLLYNYRELELTDQVIIVFLHSFTPPHGGVRSTRSRVEWPSKEVIHEGRF